MASIVKRIISRLREMRLPRVSVKPPAIVTIVLLIAISIFLLAGGVYNIMMSPPIIGYSYGLQDQSWFESIVAIILFAVGFAGVFVSYKSTRYAYKPRQAAMLLLIGVALLLTSFIGCQYIFLLKKIAVELTVTGLHFLVLVALLMAFLYVLYEKERSA